MFLFPKTDPNFKYALLLIRNCSGAKIHRIYAQNANVENTEPSNKIIYFIPPSLNLRAL